MPNVIIVLNGKIHEIIMNIGEKNLSFHIDTQVLVNRK